MPLLHTPQDTPHRVDTRDAVAADHAGIDIADSGPARAEPVATLGRIRPDALAPGALAFVAAWGVGLAIARLTGAAAVVLLLVATLVAMAGIAFAGRWRLRRVSIHRLTMNRTTTVGDELTLSIDHVDSSRASSALQAEVLGAVVALDPDGTTLVTCELSDAGIIEHLDVTVRSAGAPGLMFWRRRLRLTIEPLHVAPAAGGAPLPVDRQAAAEPGESAGGDGPRLGDLDGTRPWRAGEGQQSIHWASTLRSGEVIAYDRTTSTETRWVLPLTADAARLRRTMEDGLRHGHDVVVAVDAETGHTEPIRHREDILRWSAVAAQQQRTPPPPRSRLPVWKRPIAVSTSREMTSGLSTESRLITALAAIIALNMLNGALDASLASRAVVTIGISIATGLSLWAAAGRRTNWLRVLTGIVAVGALARIGIQSSGVSGLLEALRGPMPDLLLLLVALHGAEVVDRRTNRVHLAITGVIVAYAAGLRVDANVGWWLLAWGVVAITAVTVREPNVRTRRIRAAPIVGWAATGLAATIGLAAFVPIPDGPASLGLPSLSPSDAAVDSPGALLDSDGNPAADTPTSDGDPSRGALGEAGGYPGFSDTLDTAVRGDLGDEIVMRVRAPEPAFWRGQVFTEFDGRTWRVTPERGERVDGPQIDVPPTIGDLPAPGTTSQEFVQTFTVESDLPNVIFGAGRPETVIFDGSVVTRSDGGLRADRPLSAGTVYSVVSQRVDVTADMLRRQGDLGDFFAPFTSEPDLAPFLPIPESTSQATLDLAAELRVPGSTFDTILAYQDWMALNTEYDLNAPVPDGDAVDDFLFNSQRGFCEQIASSLVVMLRSQGVPARLATGYIPGTRDRISGVFEVKASDAHAWVEVWFPDTGWQAFDPTAEVPLAGDAGRSTVGADAAGAIFDGALSRPLELAGAILLLGSAAGALRGLHELQRRRRRGPWGLLHDRFMSLAPDAVTAPAAAWHLVTMLGPDTVGPHEVAETLDRVAFDPDHAPTSDDRRRVTADITSLERELRRMPSR
ncbi:MAG: transglutaminaseTgpA domain-containing protein [Ilumatobacter sp.]|uniref:transglutaminase family protein n=1 Tax=Ilumatobacter sp. TaxID=1967498 RepID=UPI003C76AD86